MIDWSSFAPVRQPTRKERGRYQEWRIYLKNSRLGVDEQHRRATIYAESGEIPPKD